MTLSRWFRRHQRFFLAGLVMVLMFAWGLLPTLRWLTGRGAVGLGTIREEVVEPSEFREAESTLKMIVQMTQNAHWMLGHFSSLVFRAGADEKYGSVWRFLVLLREAEAAGIDVTQGEVNDILSVLPVARDQNGFSQARYKFFLQAYGYRHTDVVLGIGDIVKILKLLDLRREAVACPTAELWMAYSHRNERANVRFVQIDGSAFVSLLKATDDEIKELYGRQSERYEAPERARVEQALAATEDVLDSVAVTGEEIGEHYGENKNDFLVKVETPVAGPDAAAAAEQEGESDAEEGGAPEGWRYKTLEEVSEEIRQELANDKADKMARELTDQVLADLKAVSREYANEPLPLAQMARRHGLRYELVRNANGDALLSREELEDSSPAGKEVADFAFGDELNLAMPKVFESKEGPMVVQVLGRRDPEPRTLEQARDQVRDDVLRGKSLARATAFAQQLRDLAAEKGLEEAVAEMNGRLEKLLGSRPDFKPLAVKHSGSFNREAGRVPGLEGDVGALVKRAFQLGVDEIGVATEESPDVRCFVIQTIERREPSPKRLVQTADRFRSTYLFQKQGLVMEKWMEALLDASQLPTSQSG